MQYAWNKYGSENFSFDIVEVVEDKSRLAEVEQKWIDSLSACDHGYNICPIATNCQGRKLSDEHKAKIALAHIGKKHSEATKAEMSLSRRGRKISEETKAKLSQCFKGRSLPEHQRLALIGNKYALGNENRAREWILTSPSGERFLVKNLSAFCRNQGLGDCSAMVEIAKGIRHYHKGWRCEYATDEALARLNSGISEQYPVKPQTRNYLITAPDGTQYQTKNLAAFCRIHDLRRAKMTLVAQGKRNHHQGWNCKYVKN